jgi:cellulose synthase/poly-beta-1,6-N-acetylglucosamine synthase-like glycosyltransferase
MNFSVLMSIYHKEKAEYFDRAMLSIWDEQTVKPNEIILVEDGKLTNELYDSICKWKSKLGDMLKIIPLEANVGTGNAKNIGLKHCQYELIAIMDTDDISLPHRFERQLKIFENENVDICSSWVGEFEYYEKNVISYRKLPQLHNDIFSFAKFRMPINHPATMYKKAIAVQAGGYQKMLWFEDYYLWIKMTLKGAKTYNIQEPLVYMRAGYGQLERRSGFAYIKEEMNFLNQIRKIGFINNFEFVRNIMIRFSARVMPRFVIQGIYKILRFR